MIQSKLQKINTLTSVTGRVILSYEKRPLHQSTRCHVAHRQSTRRHAAQLQEFLISPLIDKNLDLPRDLTYVPLCDMNIRHSNHPATNTSSHFKLTLACHVLWDDNRHHLFDSPDAKDPRFLLYLLLVNFRTSSKVVHVCIPQRYCPFFCQLLCQENV